MKRIIMSVLIIGIVGLEAKIDIKKYNNITIEKNISAYERKAYIRDAKDMGIKVINNPKFRCLNIGYTKSNLFEKGILYGTKQKDGNIKVAQKGDFKMYSFIKYFKNGAFCVETTYTKGDSRYGKGSIASLRSMHR